MFLLNTLIPYSTFVEEFVSQIAPRYYEDDFQVLLFLKRKRLAKWLSNKKLLMKKS